MDAYLEAQGVEDATELTWTDPLEKEVSEDEDEHEEEGEPTLETNTLSLAELSTHTSCIDAWEKVHTDTEIARIHSASRQSSHYTCPIRLLYCILLLIYFNMRDAFHAHGLSTSNLNECMTYRNALQDFRMGVAEHPGVEPATYQRYRAMMHAASTQCNNAHTQGSVCANAASPESDALQLANKTIKALLASQEELRAMLKIATAPKQKETPDMEVALPRVPQGFKGTMHTSLQARIGDYGNNSKRFRHPSDAYPKAKRQGLYPYSKPTMQGARGARKSEVPAPEPSPGEPKGKGREPSPAFSAGQPPTSGVYASASYDKTGNHAEGSGERSSSVPGLGKADIDNWVISEDEWDNL
ncbi:hypothetical protein BDV93DRAFT_507929 [Ceratobasidium sp. AG-I]|nr:hypothetical protein BDV93DRAFT_507929 [Ceratobasidium sp. AG-I]